MVFVWSHLWDCWVSELGPLDESILSHWDIFIKWSHWHVILIQISSHGYLLDDSKLLIVVVEPSLETVISSLIPKSRFWRTCVVALIWRLSGRITWLLAWSLMLAWIGLSAWSCMMAWVLTRSCMVILCQVWTFSWWNFRSKTSLWNVIMWSIRRGILEVRTSITSGIPTCGYIGSTTRNSSAYCGFRIIIFWILPFITQS